MIEINNLELNQFKVIISPLDLPKEVSFYLYNPKMEEEKFTDSFCKLLCAISKKNVFLGYIDSDDLRTLNLEKNEILISIYPDYTKIFNTIKRDQHERVIIVPLPVGDSWLYFDYHRILENLGFTLDTQTSYELFYKVLKSMQILHDRPLKSRLLFFSKTKKFTKRRKEQGIKRFFPKIVNTFPDTRSLVYSDGYCIKDYKSKILPHQKKIESVVQSLSNESSRKIYSKILNSHPKDLFDHFHEQILSKIQYFEYAPKFDKDSVILNFGIFTGTEIPLFLANGVGKIYCVDPLGDKHLAPYVQDWVKNHSNQVVFEESAVSAKDGTVEFSISNGQAIKQQGQKKAEVFKASTIESILNKHNIGRIDFIKVDIEGGEEEIIESLKNIIPIYRPAYAISIYHRFNHLWDLPNELIEASENYDFYINIYSFVRYETIFYGIPKEKKL